MDLAAVAIRNFVRPVLALRSRSPYLRYYKRYAKSQYWPLEKIHDYQWARMRALLEHASQHSPFYRARFAEAGLTPQAISSPGDLAQLPILTKREVQDNLDRIVVPHLDRTPYEESKTSGSTGTPLRVVMNRDASAHKRAAAIRHTEWAGWRRGEWLAMIWGDIPPPRSWRDRLRHAVHRSLVLDSQRMTPESMLRFAQQIRSTGIRCIVGQAGPLCHFADFLIERRLHDLPLRAAIPTAMVLPGKQRARLESELGWEVYERYGTEELGIIASECPEHAGLHVCAENLFLEIQGAGQTTNPNEGELIVTDLTNYAMPLIRYQIGDVVVAATSSCPCGRGLPLLERVSGRVADCITSPEGYVVSGIAITDHLADIPGIRQAQVVQEQLDELIVRIAPDDRWTDASRQRLAALIRRVFGPRMRLRCEVVHTIEANPSSKYRFSISRVTTRLV